MKHFKVLLAAIMLVAGLMVSQLDARAENNLVYPVLGDEDSSLYFEHEYTAYVSKSTVSTGENPWHENDSICISSSRPLFFYYSNAQHNYINVGYIRDDDSVKVLNSGDYPTYIDAHFYRSKTVWRENGPEPTITTYAGSIAATGFLNSYGIAGNNSFWDLSCAGAPLFDSLQSAKAFYENGDDSGLLDAGFDASDLYLVGFSGSSAKEYSKISAFWDDVHLPVGGEHYVLDISIDLLSLDYDILTNIDVLDGTTFSYEINKSSISDWMHEDFYIAYTPCLDGHYGKSKLLRYYSQSGNFLYYDSHTSYNNDLELVNLRVSSATLGGILDAEKWSILNNKTVKQILPADTYRIKWDNVLFPSGVDISDTYIVVNGLVYDCVNQTYKAVSYSFIPDLNFNSRCFDIHLSDLDEMIERYKSDRFIPDIVIQLTPCYADRVNNGLVMGPTYEVSVWDGTVKQYSTDENTGSVSDNDITLPGSSGLHQDANDYSLSFDDMKNFISSFYGFLKELVANLGAFPSLFKTVFSFLPQIYIGAIGFLFTLILILRVLGR